ncbi:MAG: DUF2834 domain-containing protein [Acidobacteriota bacterium]|nr:DUF2834 domain-containing protein [Acidobacteriota bacterium]
MTSSLIVFGALGIATTALALAANRRLLGSRPAGSLSVLEGIYLLVGLVSLGLGWYFNVRYTHLYGHRASYVHYTQLLFTNWAADSAAQDYIVVNVVLLPLWTIVDGRRRGLRHPWLFFVMSLFTSLAFAVAVFLALTERQIRYNRATSSSTA